MRSRPSLDLKRVRTLPQFEVIARGRRFAFGERTHIMGILNVTPDSFSENGAFFDKEKAVAHALDMERAGADIIDVGGESTRPGAEDVAFAEEIDRVVPVIEAIAKVSSAAISIDTRKSKVADAALRAGAHIINDVSGLRFDDQMASVAARHDAAVIIMHMKGTPKEMQAHPAYADLIPDIITSLETSIAAAKRAGVGGEKIIIDPGIGFGKTLEHNLEILRRLDEFGVLGRPICVGASRKSFIGKLCAADDPADRLSGTIAAGVIAIMKGANILRVHDVKEARDAAVVADAIIRQGAQ